MKRITACVGALASLATTLFGLIGTFAPVPQPDSKSSFVVFTFRVFAVEMIFIGATGLLLFIAHRLGWLETTTASFRAVFGGAKQKAAVVSGRERRKAILLVCSATAVSLIAAGYAALPAARLALKYVRSGQFMSDYRVELLIQARAAEVRGEIEDAIAALNHFEKIFPDRAELNGIPYMASQLTGRIRVADALSRRADTLQEAVGTTRAVLSLRVLALSLNPGRVELHQKADSALARARYLVESARTTLSLCSRSAASAQQFSEALYAIGFDYQPHSLVGRGNLADRHRRFCAALTGWTSEQVAAHVERVWGLEMAARAIAAMSADAREARGEDYLKSARAQVREKRRYRSEVKAISDRFFQPEPSFLHPVRMGQDDDLSRGIYWFHSAGNRHTYCWFEPGTGHNGIRMVLDLEALEIDLAPEWCRGENRLKSQGRDVLRLSSERDSHGVTMLEVLEALSNNKYSQMRNREPALRAICWLAVTLYASHCTCAGPELVCRN
jgi:hypothetical protein